MQRQKVSSEAIHSIGYNPEKKILEVEFNSGNLYQYFEVPEVEAKNFLTAESQGTYFHNEILKRYEFIRLDLIKPTEGFTLRPLKSPRLPHL